MYHITERRYLNPILRNGLLVHHGITDKFYICLSSSIENCLGLAPMCTSIWPAKNYYDRQKETMIGSWYCWKTCIYQYPVLRVDVTDIENHLHCFLNKDYQEYFLYGRTKYIPEYKCDCDISPDRVQYYTDWTFELDMIDITRMRSKPESDWRRDRIIIKDKEGYHNDWQIP